MSNEIVLNGSLGWEVERLRQQIREARFASFNYAWTAMAQEYWPEQAQFRELPPAGWWRIRLQKQIDEIEQQQLEPSASKAMKTHTGQMGTEFQVLAPRKILRGYLVPIREVPIPLTVSARMLALIEIAGESHKLDRHLDQGIHYHYTLANGTHTSTMICWDKRWLCPPNAKPPATLRPIFHELHGRGSKTKKARPELWSDRKRESIWDACARDLQTWKISEFRCASDNAAAVWPPNAFLTPRATDDRQLNKK